MLYDVFADFALAVRHLGDAEFFLAAGIAGFGAIAVALTRALHGSPVIRREPIVEHDEAA